MVTLTPDEQLGLSGRALDGQVRRAFRRLPAAAVRGLTARLRAGAIADGLLQDYAVPGEPVRILPQPLCVRPEQLQYIHRVSLTLVDALRRLPGLWLADAALRAALPLSPAEEAFIRDVWTPAHADLDPLYARLDAVCDFTAAGWRDGLRYLEANLSCVGGILIAPTVEEALCREVVPLLRAYDPTLQIDPPRDQHDLFVQLLLDHAAAIGRRDRRICLLGARTGSGGDEELAWLAAHLRARHRLTVVAAQPEDLRLRGDEVYCGDVEVDVAYRDYEIREFLAAEARGVDIAPIRRLFRRNQIVSGVGGEFDHKAGFELLGDPEAAARWLPAEVRRTLARHIPWTRRLAGRRTTLPDGQGAGDLLEYTRRERERLVLKPNRGFGGEGVFVGPSTSQAAWESAIDRALGDPDGWVVQRLVELPVHEFPVVDAAGNVVDEPFYAVMGFAPTDAGVAVLGRVSQKRVVNICQRGGVCAVLLGHADPPRGPGRAADEPALPQLRGLVATLRHLDAALDLLGWDEETYLPAAAREGRAGQSAALEAVRHAHLTSPLLGGLLAPARAEVEAGGADARALDLLARRRARALALPEALVAAFAEARSRSLAAWEAARVRRDFAAWAPALARLVELARARAEALARGGDPYDALLGEHDEGVTRATAGPLLTALRERLVPLVGQVARPAAPIAWLSGQVYPDAAQDRLCREMLAAIGFDFERGRLDRSTHPFTLVAGFDDVRMTVHVEPTDPTAAIFSALHEGGHGLYDQGFDPAHRGTLLAQAPGMWIHESQARLWENVVGRGRPFWTHWFPRLRAAFPDQLAGVDLDRFLADVNRVRVGPVRLLADEVTYNLHILLRYRLEERLIAGHLRVDDLPLAWREQSEQLLGVAPADDLEGVLQDVHWAVGLFGYFPSYAIGNLAAAQLFAAFTAAHPDWDDAAAAGDLRPLRAWLRRHVHRAGHLREADEVVREATGEPLSAEPFLRHLEQRYLAAT